MKTASEKGEQRPFQKVHQAWFDLNFSVVYQISSIVSYFRRVIFALASDGEERRGNFHAPLFSLCQA